MKRSGRLVSVFLTFVMLLGLVPAWSIPVNAMEEVKVRTWAELETALWEGNTTKKIVLQNDIEKHIEYDTEADYVKSEDPTIHVYGTKVLDLNGYNIICSDNANVAYVPEKGQVETGSSYHPGFRMSNYLISVSSSATLTVQDTASGKGGIHFDGYMIGTLGSGEKYKYHWYTTRDVFEVWGTLILDSGRVIAGRSKEQWITNGRIDYDHPDHIDEDSSRFDGNARQQIWGSAVSVAGTGKFVMNGGMLEGRGEINHENLGSVRDSVVFMKEGATAVINNGALYAKGGANVFSGSGIAAGLKIKQGIFVNEKLEYIRDFDDLLGMYSTGTCHERIIPGSYGDLGIPDQAWKSDVGDGLGVTVKYLDGSKAGRTETYTSYSETSDVSLGEVAGEVSVFAYERNLPNLAFHQQEPAMEPGAASWHYYVPYGKAVTYTFNHVPLTAQQIAQGYTVERSASLIQEIDKKTVKSVGPDAGTGKVTLSYTFRNTNMYRLVESLTLKKNGVTEKTVSNVFYLLPEPEVESISVVNQPTKSAYLPGELFDPAGMVVLATFSDNSTRDVTDSVEIENTVEPITSDMNQIPISYTTKFPWEKTVHTTVNFKYGVDVSEFSVLDIKLPSHGAKPDYQGTLGNDMTYQFADYGLKSTGIYWYDADGYTMEESDRFVGGKTYTLEVKLEPKTVNGVAMSNFKTPVTVSLNGSTLPSEDVYASTKNIYIYKEFICEGGKEEKIRVGGVSMGDGDYLSPGSYITTEHQPGAAYAYYKDDKLVLHNFTITNDKGEGIYRDVGDLQIVLSGNSAIVFSAMKEDSAAIMAVEDCKNLTITQAGGIGGGSLTVRNAFCGIYSGGNITVEAGTYNMASVTVGLMAFGTLTVNDGDFYIEAQRSLVAQTGIFVHGGEMNLNGPKEAEGTTFGFYTEGDVEITDVDLIADLFAGIYANNKVTISGGKINIKSIFSSIAGHESVSVTGGTIKATSFYVDEEEEEGGAIFGGEEGNVVTFGSGLKITASTEPDGTPGPYNVSNHVLYDLILVTPVGSGSYLAGDVDNDGDVDLDDAIYLLYHVNFPTTYPVSQPIDFNGDGGEDLDDAIYLLYHVNFKETYPLH